MNTPHHPSLEAMMATFDIAAMALAVAIILSGCAIPIPPSGADSGKYGTLYITPRYEPNYLTTPSLTPPADK
jgi:hypothetical protein